MLNYFISQGFSWITPQIISYAQMDSVLSGYVQSAYQFSHLLTSLINPIIIKKVVTRWCLWAGFLVPLLICVPLIVLADNVTLYLILSIVLFFFQGFVIFNSYALIMISVPQEMNSKVNSLPTISHMMACSLITCIFSSVQVRIGVDNYFSGVRVNTGIIALSCAIGLLLSLLRIGNMRSERGKLGFKQEYIREVIR